MFTNIIMNSIHWFIPYGMFAWNVCQFHIKKKKNGRIIVIMTISEMDMFWGCVTKKRGTPLRLGVASEKHWSERSMLVGR